LFIKHPHEPDGQTDIAIEVLKEFSSRNKPFAFLSYGTPHDPWTYDNVPKEYLEMFRNIEFTLPSNYKEENDPYAETSGVDFLLKSEKG